MESFEPEKEYLNFNINLESVPPELADVVISIKQTAEKLLFHWKKFPLTLPSPLLDLSPLSVTGPGGDGDVSTRKAKTTSLRDVYVVPDFGELDIVSKDAKGNSPRLDSNQLASIRDRGEFEVKSLSYPGQTHKWRLSPLLQRGRLKTNATLMQDVSTSLRLVVVTARNRIYSPFLSFSQSWKSMHQGISILLDALVGLPSVSAEHLMIRLQEERVKHLVAELTVDHEYDDDLEHLCHFVRYQIKKQTFEKCHISQDHLPCVPYLYRTPKGQQIDLRLFNAELLRKTIPHLAQILEKEIRGWFPVYKEKIIAELKEKKLLDAEIEKHAKAAIQDEYLRRVFVAIQSDNSIRNISDKLGALLVEQAHSTVLMQRALNVVRERLSEQLTQEQVRFEEEHPLLSSIKPWLKSRLQFIQEELESESKFEAHEVALQLCKEYRLQQVVYFLQRDLIFMREHEPILKEELSRMQNPTRIFSWRTPLWCPTRWQVRRLVRGEVELVPTVISHDTLSQSNRRSDPDQPVYIVEKQWTHNSSTRWPLWRWINYIYRTWSWTWNAMFILGVVIPWCSPISLRALILPQPFMPDFEVGQEDGVLHPRKSSLTPTLWSRLHTLWRQISKSRTDFESKPDTGFIGKGFSRHVNRVWNYVLKGVLGTVFLVLGFPIICLAACGASIVAAILTPLWMPCATLILHVIIVLAYDFDCPDPKRNKICILLEALIWHILILGLFQPLIALVIACLICPLGAALVLFVAVVRWAAIHCWDLGVFHLVIKRRARIPLSDSWMVQRVEGPGLSQDHYFQISPEQAIAAFVAKLESEELTAFQEQTERKILQPQLVYGKFVQWCFGPFAGTLSKDGPYRELEVELQDMISTLKAQIEKRKKELQTGLGVTCRSRIRMSQHDLQVTLVVSTSLARQIYPLHILCRLEKEESKYWQDRGLQEKDWLGLASHLYSEIFSSEVLTPLQDSSVVYKLETSDIDLSKYQEIIHAHMSSDIDVTRVIHTPKGKINLHPPYIDLSIFNPQSTSSGNRSQSAKSSHSNYPWKQLTHKQPDEKLNIPLPIPHPVKIAMIIFNRENEDPVPLESETCQQILKVVSSGSALRGDNTADSFGSHSSLTSSRSPSVTLNMPSVEDISLEPGGQRVTYTHSSYSTCV